MDSTQVASDIVVLLMVLYLYGQQQLADCLTLVGADDTLLIMDAGLLEVAGDTLSALPCAVMLLDDTEGHSTDHCVNPVMTPAAG